MIIVFHIESKRPTHNLPDMKKQTRVHRLLATLMKKRGSSTSIALFFLVSALLTPALQAQDRQQRGEGNELTRLPLLSDQLPNVYRFVRAGQPSIRVLVLGSVQNQGFYFVEPSVNVEDVMLYAGGPSAVGQLKRLDVLVREQRRPEVRFTISRLREDGQTRYLASEVRLSEILDGSGELPILQNEDILLVETEEPNPPLYRDILDVTQTVLTVGSSTTVFLWIFGVIDRRR